MSKRVVSLLLTLLLALSVCIPVFATTVEPADQTDVSESAETEETAPETEPEEEPSEEEPAEEAPEEEAPAEEPEATSDEVDEISQKEIETIASTTYYVAINEDKTKLTFSTTQPGGSQGTDWWSSTTAQTKEKPWQSVANKASVKSVEFKDSISNLNGHQLFSGFTSLETVTFIAKVTFTMTINEMFMGCTNLKTIEKPENFDVSSVTNMRDTFNGCESLEVLDLSSWNTSKVSDLTDMFEGCKSLTKLNISSWDTTDVTYEVNLFDGCLSLRELTVGSNFKLKAGSDTNEHKIHDQTIAQGSFWIKGENTEKHMSDSGLITSFEDGNDHAGTYYWVHEIWYNVNGDGHGTAPVDGNVYKYGESATLLDKGGITEKDQEVFIGWSEDHKSLVKSEADAKGVMNPGGKVQFTDQAIEVYAVFAEDINRNKTPDYKENRVTVTFDINDGDGSKEDEEGHKTTYTVENLLPGTPLVLRVYYTLKWTKEWTKDGKPATHPAILAGWTTDESVAQDIILENDVDIDPDGAHLSEKLEHRYNVVVPDKDTTYYAVYAEDENGDETMDFLEDSLQVEYYANGGQHIHGWIDGIEGLVFRCMHHHVPDEDGVTLLSVDLGKQWVKRDGAVLLGWAEQPTDLVTDAAQETAAKIVTSVKMPEKENKKVYAVWAIDENGNGTPDYEETVTPEEPTPEPKPTPSAEPEPTPEATPSTKPTPTPTPKPDYGIIPDVPWYQYQPEDEGEYVPGPDEVTNSGFPDVDPNAWYAGPVDWAAQSGVTAGYPDGNFHPDDTCTRAQIVTFLWKAAGTPMSVGTVSFSDVEQGSFYYDAAVWAANSGIIAGYPDGNFHPDDPCTRAQIVAMLYRYANSPAVSGESKFFDVDAGAYYYSAAIWAEQNGIVAGYPDGGFHPNDACTRAQIVTMLYNYIKG